MGPLLARLLSYLVSQLSSSVLRRAGPLLLRFSLFSFFVIALFSSLTALAASATKGFLYIYFAFPSF
ncbi:hypothetical protein L211DRAFT_497524 [Terfezia boudieri ATCC MYA-4762]|uniref:Uncharacterized protein n=1 Tax=Terfezia boudieri ATCC MYA-4762 TaxID=1051890 RepID=A0A3N4LJM9_9PEZI|nr:hypothetical protein L211DRAFT_497524 [Terfezia boudieri ATCC MYA-4762]